MPDPPTDRLTDYRRKRDRSRTPEPFGEASTYGQGIFVVQKHAATRLHYDLRLEHDGVLMSWAVPQGVSFDPAVKRFAAHTEDHPLDYADFEGVIPKDEYGGGEMIVWDRGALTWDEDPDEGIAKGKLLFTLSGYKLNGQWTLVHMKNSDWLLIKHRDGWVRPDGEDPPSEASILTGRTVEDLAHGAEDAARVIAALDDLEAPRIKDLPDKIEVMLAETADAPFTRAGWLFEIKYDGYRLVARKHGRNVALQYRSGLDATAIFPEIVSAIRRLPYDDLVIDGEIAVLDDDGKPQFGLLQRRGRLGNRHDIARAAATLPATMFVFDLISLEGRDVRPLALRSRKELLSRIVPKLGPLRYADHIETMGEAMFAQVQAMGLEGIVAKDASSKYLAGRSSAWQKVKAEHTASFAIVGYTAPKGSRHGVGALHLARMSDGTLTYTGRVGSGISDSDLTTLGGVLSNATVSAPRVAGEPPTGSEHTWVEPSLSAVVRFKEITDDGLLRQPVLESWGDLDLDDVLEAPSSSDPPPPAVIDARTSEPTNVDKVFWPEEGYTKGDLIGYYTAVADNLLPYLAGRPLVLDRYPDGIDGKSFFQKNAPEFVPDWIRTEWIGDEDGKGNTYFLIDDVEGLRYLANLASIPIHVWASRLDSLDAPDWCILDLDPKGAPFTDVVDVAKEIKKVCDRMDIPSYPKTSGKTGLHVLIPLGRSVGYAQQKMLGELIARVVETKTRDIATTVRNPAGRDGKVYIDFLQNGRGKLIVGPYSVRPVPGATVSAPLRWSEVTKRLDPGKYTILTMPKRLASLASDPHDGLLSDVPDIRRGLAAIAAEVA